MVERISRERLEAPPGETYTKTILAPSYEFMREHYFFPLVEVNRAWAVMLVETGMIADATGKYLLKVLDELWNAGPEAIGDFNPNHEYFYSHVEHYLTDRCGEEVAGEINIGRTRPEPLARMALRRKTLALLDELGEFRRTLLEIADREKNTVMPQWTHQQQAQLSTVGHWLVGMENALARDWKRLAAAYQTTNQCTLGCGALSGSSYEIDRDRVAALLGFDGFQENTIDCVSSSDFALETVSAIGGMMVNLSRLCQDLYFWQTEEFGFVEIADEYAGSSSMMPQKKNAYPFEYVRARAAHAVGDMAAAFGTLHNTNFQDIKDVEEEVIYPVFHSLTEASRSLRLLKGTIETLTFKREKMFDEARRGFACCTELAALIHRETGLSYRTAHRIVGRAVLEAYKRGLDATGMDAHILKKAARAIGHYGFYISEETVRKGLDAERFVEAHDLPGGPSTAQVEASLKRAARSLDEDKSFTDSCVGQIEKSGEELDKASSELVGGR